MGTGSEPQTKRVREKLVLFLANLLAIAFASQRFFHALFLAGFQVEGVTLNLFDNVFGLNFALETAQGIFERFTFLNSNLCQGKYTSQSGPEWLSINDTLFQNESNRRFTKFLPRMPRISKGFVCDHRHKGDI